MNTDYEDFLKRLREERVSISLSQLELGQALRMTQSHYSKVELGTRRLSYYEMQYLCELNMDMYYIFSGTKSDTEMKCSFVECSFEELVCYLEVVCSVIMCLKETGRLKLTAEMLKRIRNIQYVIMPSEKQKTIFSKLRRTLGYSQMKMANILGVDVKKLRGMEKGKILPDSEIIWRLSEWFCIPYALFLKDKRFLVSEINYLLKIIEENKRNAILNGIEIFHGIIQCDTREIK